MSKKIIVTGGSGMVGQGFKDFDNIILTSSADCDLTNQVRVESLFRSLVKYHEIEGVIHLAAKVGGVKGNTDYVGDYFYDNIMMNTNVLHACHKNNINNVISLLSTCVYPEHADFPLTEDQIHEGKPHKSNFGYAYSKRMLDVHSRAYRQQYNRNYITAIPNNLYGPNDMFDLENGHVIPSVIRKIWEAKQTGIPPIFWGDGTPLREFTYSEDIAPILIFLLENYSSPHPINIGNVNEYTISSVVSKISKHLDYNGDVVWDDNYPSGIFRKPSSINKLVNLGWDINNYTPLNDGLKSTCEWFKKEYPNVRGV